MSASLRLSRTSGSSFRAVRPEGDLLGAHAALTAIIRRHLPGVAASLLALPRRVEGTDQIEWHSDLAGQPVRLDSLDETNKAQARALLADRIAAVRALAERLPRIDPANAGRAELLRAAVSYPGDAAVYVVNGQPVLTFWGFVDPQAPTSVVSSDKADTVYHRASWLTWLAGTAALFLVAAALWYLWPRSKMPVPEMAVPETGAITPELVARPAKPIPSQVEQRRSDPPLAPVIDGALAATAYCEEEKIIAPPTVIVYDNSGSMAYPLNMPEDEVTTLNEKYHADKFAHEQRTQWQAGLNQFARALSGSGVAASSGGRFPTLPVWVKRNYPSRVERYGPQRVRVAKPLVAQLLDEIPADVPLGMVAFSDCNKIGARFANAGSARSDLQNLIAGLIPDGGTPIGASLRRAADMLDGTSEQRAGLIVLITDGVEQCNEDPCAIARSIKRHKPWVAAHVVKLGPEASSACVAEVLEGKVYQPNSAEALSQAVAEARITAPFQLGCRQ